MSDISVASHATNSSISGSGKNIFFLLNSLTKQEELQLSYSSVGVEANLEFDIKITTFVVVVVVVETGGIKKNKEDLFYYLIYFNGKN